MIPDESEKLQLKLKLRAKAGKFVPICIVLSLFTFIYAGIRIEVKCYYGTKNSKSTGKKIYAGL